MRRAAWLVLVVVAGCHRAAPVAPAPPAVPPRVATADDLRRYCRPMYDNELYPDVADWSGELVGPVWSVEAHRAGALVVVGEGWGRIVSVVVPRQAAGYDLVAQLQSGDRIVAACSLVVKQSRIAPEVKATSIRRR